MTHVCEYCEATFSLKHNLAAHQRSAAYCLALRGGETEHECEWCGNVYRNLQSFKRHNKTCRIKIVAEAKIDEKTHSLKAEIEKLKPIEIEAKIYKQEYLAIRDKPRVTNNNNTTINKLKNINISTIDPFTITTVQKRLERGDYSYELFLRGYQGLKTFFIGIMIKDDEQNYASTGGKTRPSFHRLEDTREWTEDRGTKFIATVFDEMKPIVKTYWDRLAIDLRTVEFARNEKEIQRLTNIQDSVKKVAFGISYHDSTREILLGELVKQLKSEIAID